MFVVSHFMFMICRKLRKNRISNLQFRICNFAFAGKLAKRQISPYARSAITPGFSPLYYPLSPFTHVYIVAPLPFSLSHPLSPLSLSPLPQVMNQLNFANFELCDDLSIEGYGGVVWKAVRKDDGLLCAVKVLRSLNLFLSLFCNHRSPFFSCLFTLLLSLLNTPILIP
jgi:hypothetical protein